MRLRLTSLQTLRRSSQRRSLRVHPKAPGGEEPIPEGIWWLLCTGDIPTLDQTAAITKEWNARADLPAHVARMLDNFPDNLHPMAQFVAAIAALNNESKFAVAYSRGVPKNAYWEYAYEDSMGLLAKLPTIAAMIYRNLYRDGSAVGVIDPKKDWSANFCSILGYDDPLFAEAKNPWPNVDAHSGVLPQYFVMTEMSFYTELFGVSRALGCLSELTSARGACCRRQEGLTTPTVVRFYVRINCKFVNVFFFFLLRCRN